jgi:iron complex transport system ATP-binding protein
MTLLAADDLVVEANGRRIVDGVALGLGAGELVGLIGPNGSGKSTTMRVMLNLQKAARGRVTLDGREVRRIPRRDFARRVAYLPQGGEVHWPLTVQRVVELGRLPHRAPWAGIGPGDRHAIARALEDADVAHLAARIITTLSGGERMLAHVARVLAGEPEIILADEPTASLDPYHQLQVMELLRRIAARGGSVLVILHDLILAARYCERLVLLDQGRVVAAGAPSEILTDDKLAATYRVEALRGAEGEERFVIPWRTIG